MNKIAAKCFAFEEVRHLRLDALVAAGDRSDRRGRGDCDHQAIAQAMGFDLFTKRVPPGRSVRSHTPKIELQITACRSSFAKCHVRAFLNRKFTRSLKSREIDLFLYHGRDLSGRVGIERQSHLEENVLQAHEAKADVSPAIVRSCGGRYRVIIQINNAVELHYREMNI